MACSLEMDVDKVKPFKSAWSHYGFHCPECVKHGGYVQFVNLCPVCGKPNSRGPDSGICQKCGDHARG